MTATLPKKAGLRWPIEDWAHRASVASLIETMKSEGYAPRSICSALRMISAFLIWKDNGGEGDPKPLNYHDIDNFINESIAAGTRRNGEVGDQEFIQAENCPQATGLLSRDSALFMLIDFGADIRPIGFAPAA
ncbi:hypothetical protein [Shinella sp. JR1-6]|uniref:hypothetical protein n=1 Tax=Shinella sp. JR1-6 TaxID=2527671 RepID=UPI00102D55F4|nr:hypothetical protein [Shinella sp. JR1-6]TAA49457.1 hypothetical protein EXZ48_34275 [Shinella sp. JR1-6]